MKTDEELKSIAKDLYQEKIFCDRFLHDPKTELSMVFMAIALLDKQTAEELMSKKPAFIYEYYSKAGPMSVNGYPTFFSFKFLIQEEYEKMIKYFNKIIESVNNL